LPTSSKKSRPRTDEHGTTSQRIPERYAGRTAKHRRGPRPVFERRRRGNRPRQAARDRRGRGRRAVAARRCVVRQRAHRRSTEARQVRRAAGNRPSLPDDAKSTGPIPPYGTVEEKVEFAFGRLGSALQELQAFAAEARAALPNEYAAWIIWDAQKQKLQYRPLPATSATPGSITFDRPALAEHESLAIDLHSHGDSAAFFSATDDADDAGEVKIAGVFGGLGAGSEPDVAFRLCVLGMFIPLKVPAAAIFKQPQEA
jgi:PRTRC genetic system protein A